MRSDAHESRGGALLRGALRAAAIAPLLLAACPVVDNVAIFATVRGLTGTGLVLSVTLYPYGALQDVPVRGNGRVTLAYGSAGGHWYDVRVDTQPHDPVQTCTVSNGSGTVADGGSEVLVTCSEQTYQLVATVSGFAGDELILQETESGGVPVHVTADGQVVLDYFLADGAPYTVAVLRQPQNPARECTVTPASGTVQGADVSLAVSCS